MSSNSSVPQPIQSKVSHPQSVTGPDYAQLVQFLLQPFLESQNSLRVDCEISSNTARVWIRVAFEGEDKGRVFGRGGRNIQAIRTVVAAAATAAGHSAYLD
ncbi:MAG: KH domain-containing protein, partial [Chroococcidiopsidaceae cyanobacterium CP_BM_RX_35]|nr:KH domain-containing protein [Chroococcidiopsidaceae cyanobacterium CP_BM_RX_35]